MANISQSQLNLFPERVHQCRSALHGTESAPCIVTQFTDIPGTAVTQLMWLEMSVQEFRRIGRQEFNLDFAVTCLDVLTHQAAFENLQTFPDNQQFLSNLVLERLEKFYALRGTDGSRKQPEIDKPEADTGDHRQLPPGKAVMNHRSLPLRAPTPHQRGALRQARFIDEYNHSSLFCGVFFSAGQRLVFHSRTACSLRCRARHVGRWQLNPFPERIRDILDSESRTPKRPATTLRVHPRVQTSVVNPLARAPFSDTRFNSRRSALSSDHGRPRCPLERSTSNPPSSRRLTHPQSVDRATPTRRATSAYGTPFRRRRSARSRRFSNSLHCVLLSMESSQHTRFHRQRIQKNIHYLCGDQ